MNMSESVRRIGSIGSELMVCGMSIRLHGLLRAD